MKLIIEIDLDNAAFKTERGLDGAEILSTVQNVGLKAAHNVHCNEPFTFTIKDQNGNTIGFCELVKETCHDPTYNKINRGISWIPSTANKT